jgi:hypothetical protein
MAKAVEGLGEAVAGGAEAAGDEWWELPPQHEDAHPWNLD